MVFEFGGGFGGEVFFCFADEVEAAGDADEVFFGHSAVGDAECFFEIFGDLGHLAIEFDISGGQFVRVGGADAVDAGEDDFVGAAGDALEHAWDIFIATTSEDDDHRVVGDVLADGFHGGIKARGVMGAVDDDARGLRDHLHAAGDGDLGEAFHRAGVVDGDATGFEAIDDGEGEAAVDGLMLADEWNGEVLEFAVGSCQADAVVRPEHPAGFEAVAEFDGLAGDVERRADFFGDLFEGGFGHRVLNDADGGNAVLEDAGLFRGDVGQGGAELGHVIVADAGDGGDFGFNDVGAVEAATQAGFDDSDVDFIVGEVFECDGGEDIEIGRRRLETTDHGLDQANQTSEIGLGDHVTVDDDALANIYQMRAGVEANLVAVGDEHGGDHRASAALAFGSGNVDGAEMILRIAQLFEEGSHTIEVEVVVVVAHDAEALVITERGQELQ